LVIGKNKLSIVEILKKLQKIETDVMDLDRYVYYIIKKYKKFKYDIKVFIGDD